jgi:uncharacterized protein
MTDQIDQESTIEFLSRGAAYGRPHESVQRIDTHASVVFLIGDRAYKLKRGIRFSYLDYSTAEKREAMCRAELALNRRTAPQLYLGICTVTRAPDGALALGGTGQAVDWLVEMRRFPQDDLFDRLAERHALTMPLMVALADEIAAFHNLAEPCGDDDFDTRMQAIVSENLDNLRRTGDELDQRRVADLAAHTRVALDRAAPILKRCRSRRCHGDLHLRNICLIDGRPVLFDGIEFNDAFTCTDPLYDLAFLLMDLDHRDLDDFGNAIFNRYFDRVVEPSSLALLPLYLSVRAGVRAHVSIAALERQGDERNRRVLAQSAARYLDAAIRFLQPAQPRLVAVGGRSGSGKSAVARALAPGFAPAPGARVLRSDVIRKRLHGVAPETRLPKSAYDEASDGRVYRALYAGAADIIGAGYCAIVDAAFLRPAERTAVVAAAAAAGVAFTGLWLEAPPDTLRHRIAQRQGDASDADSEVLRSQLALDLGAIDWTTLAADSPLDAVTDEARRAIERRP